MDVRAWLRNVSLKTNLILAGTNPSGLSWAVVLWPEKMVVLGHWSFRLSRRRRLGTGPGSGTGCRACVV
jgi:hypothetical protein